MVGIVAGSGLGLDKGALQALGDLGVVRDPNQGAAGESVYVNASNGNLIIRDQDEMLLGLGANASVLRSYNSQGGGWREGATPTVTELTGTLNTAGSTVTRTDWDGSRITYTWDASRAAYVSMSPGAAKQTLTGTASRWTLRDDGTHTIETYDATAGGRLISRADIDGNTTSFLYNAAGQLLRVTTRNGDKITLGYDASNRLVSVTSVYTGTSGTLVTSTRTRYGYDAQGRLSTVTVDLSPDDGSIADGNVYVTTYTYDGTTDRVAAILNPDGTSTSFTYKDGWIATITETTASGAATTSTLVHTTLNGGLTVTGIQGETVNYDYQTQTGVGYNVTAPTGTSQRTFLTDADGRVVRRTNAAGIIESYTYDAAGNVTRIVDRAGNVVDRTYGAHDELLSEFRYTAPTSMDPSTGKVVVADGPTTRQNLVRYVYDAEQHLRFTVTAEGRVTEMRYSATGLLTSTIVYSDATYAIDTFVTPSEASLTDWLATIDASRSLRTDVTYDARGMVSLVTSYASTAADGTGLATGEVLKTHYVYDAHGRLIQRFGGSGATVQVENNTYDALGRLTSTSGASGAVTTYQYSATAHTMVQHFANGLVRTSTYDAANQLVSVVDSGSAGTIARTTYGYDSGGRLVSVTDPDGGVHTYIYDYRNLKTIEIDPSGKATSYIYDTFKRVTQTTVFAISIDAAQRAAILANDGVPTSNPNDRTTHFVYDVNGRVVKSFDSEGNLTENVYDADGQMTTVIAYATRVVNGEYNAVPSSLDDRVTHLIHDKDGLLTGTIDAEGYLTETRYNAAGQRVETIHYATAVPGALRGDTDIASLRPAANASDVHARYVYDDRGLLTDEIDGEGNLTSYTYDAYGNVASRSRGVQLTSAVLAGGVQTAIHFTAKQVRALASVTSMTVYVDGVALQTVSVPKSGALGTFDLTLPLSRVADHLITFDSGNIPVTVQGLTLDGQAIINQALTARTTSYVVEARQLLGSMAGATDVTSYAYDGDGRLLQSTTHTVDRPDATVNYVYDAMGNVIAVRGPGRGTMYRYDLKGNVIARLDGRGVEALDALGATPTAAQVDAVWSAWATHLTYDAAGLLTSQTDATGARTVYFYDADGRLKAQVNGVGEVARRDYDAFGNLVRTTAYGKRLSATDTATLTGGIYDGAIDAKLTAIDGDDAGVTTMTYTSTGRLAEVDSPLGNFVRYTYDAFGDVVSTLRDTDGVSTTRTDTTYDHLGQATSATVDAGALNLVTRSIRDAFGRVTETVDADGVHRTWQYDRSGNVIAMTDGTSATTHSTYDALGRVLSHTDAAGHTTTYAYLGTGGIRTTTPEGIVTTQVLDANGQTVSLTDGASRTTHYAYDSEGNLLSVTDAAGTATTAYDKSGHTIRATDASGRAVAYTYDAAGRVLTRSVDPDGLKLTTTYAYDARGNAITTTDPVGRMVTSHYDLDNRVVSTVLDEGGLNVTTQFLYDATGHVVLKLEGNAKTTKYVYDGAGRLVSTMVDPNVLKLTTTYTYDANGNVMSKAEGDANGTMRLTRYTYDGEGRVLSTVVDPDGLALATHYTYDVMGRVTAVADAGGHVSRTAYDTDGRIVYTVDPIGVVTHLDYDAAGNVVRRTTYARAIDVSTFGGTSPGAADIAARVVTGAADRVTRYAYDASNRLRFAEQPNGQIVEQVSDASGNLVRSVAYTQPAAIGADFSEQAVAQAVSTTAGRATRYVYDAADRLAFTIDASGAVTETAYDGLDTVASKATYLKAYTATANPSMADMLAWRAGAVATGRHATTYFHDAAGRVLYAVDGERYVTMYQYDALGNVTNQFRYNQKLPGLTDTTTAADVYAAMASSTSYVYTSMAYDGAGRLNSRSEPNSRTTQYQLDALGRTIATTQALGTADAATTRWTYDVAGNMTSESRVAAGPNGTTVTNTTGYVYDASGHRTQVIDARGMRVSDRTSNAQDVLALRKSLGVLDSAGEGKSGASLTDADVALLRSYFTTTTDYDADGRAVAVHAPYGAMVPGGPTVATTRTSYDVFGDAAKVVDARGGEGYFYFDHAGQVIGQVDPAGYYTRTTRDLFGNVTKVEAFTTPVTTVDPVVPPQGAGNVATTTFTYDGMNRLLSTTDALGGVESYTYDAAGDRTSITNKLGGTTVYTYDGVGNVATETLPITTRDAAGNAVAVTNQYDYDARGNRVGEHLAVGSNEEIYVLNQYDGLDHLQITQVFDVIHGWAKVASTQNAYDGRGNLIYTEDASGKGTRYYYDASDRLIVQVSPSGAQIRNEYDAAGNKIRTLAYLDLGPSSTISTLSQPMPSIPGAGARETLYTYDAANRLTRQSQPNVITAQATGGASTNANFQTSTGITQTWTYDANGQLTSHTDGAGHVTHTWYDKLGHAILGVDANGYATVWTRDADGNVLTETKYATQYAGDPATIANPAAPGLATSANDRVTTFTYDKNGRVLTQTVKSVSYGTVDGNGHLTQGSGDAITTYAYDAAGNLLRQTDASGSLFSFTYDLAGRKLSDASPSFTDYAGRVVQVTTSYVYDAHNNVIRETRSGGPGGTDQVNTYTYDAAAHLISTTNAAGYTTTMTYDASGNLVTMSNTLTDAQGTHRAQVVTMSYDAEHREISRTTTLGGVAGTARHTRYNALGEVTGRGVGDTYQEVTDYDLAGRVLRTNADQGRTKIYLYDGNGNATLAVEAQNTDLLALDLLSPLGVTNFNALFAVPALAWTLTVYDGVNHVVDVIQPTMDIHTAYLGLQAQQVPGGGPGQISVSVGGPTGPNRTLPGVDGANLLGTTPGGSVGTAHASLHWEHAGAWTYMPTTMLLDLDVPDLTSIFGAYSITVTIGSKTIQRGSGAISLRNEPMPVPAVPGTWTQYGGDAAYTMSITVVPANTGAAVSLGSVYSGVGHVTYSQTPQNGGVIGGGPPAVDLPINLGTPKLKLSAEDSAHINAGSYRAQVYIRPWGSTGAYMAYGVAGGTPATVDLSGLQSGAYYEVLYVAEDTNGNLVRSEQYQLLGGNSATLTYGPYQQPGGAYTSLSGGGFVITNNSLVAMDLRKVSGDRAKHAVMYYRPMGSTGGYNGIGDYNNFVRGGAMFSLGGVAAGTYQVIIYLLDDGENIVNELDGSMTLGGSASISLAYPRPADNNITLTNLPPTASVASILFTNQRTGQQIATGNLAITTPGSLAWAIPQSMFDGSGAATNWTMTVTLSDGRVQPPSTYTATGTITVGSARPLVSFGVNVQGNVYTLNITPTGANNQPVTAGQYLVLRYWQDGADIANHPELIQRRVIQKSPNGQYQWDSIGLDPNVTYAYNYDVYATQAETQNEGAGVSLSRSEGRFQPKNTTANQEAHWVVTGINDKDVTVHRRQGWDAFGDIVRETDGNGNTTDLAYNNLGKLMQRTEALVQTTYANGYVTTIRPQTKYIYDLAGRQVGLIDANGNVTTQAWNNALNKVAMEFHADGGVVSHQYDAVGNERLRITALGAGLLGDPTARRTDYTYDSLNRLVRADGPVINGQRSFDTYTYDEQDRRIAHTNVLGRDTVAFDVEGNVSATTSAAGRTTTYTTVWNASANGGKGAWVQTTTLPSNMNSVFAEDHVVRTLVDTRNTFGQVLSHIDAGGHSIVYSYYLNGLLKQQGNSEYAYYNNGLLKTIMDDVTGIREIFEYDNNGNVTFDGLTNRNADWAFQQSVSVYDSLNRLVKVTDPRYVITYEYDAMGNRIHMNSKYNDALGQPGQVQDYWYEYDMMNRFTVTMGQLAGGVRGTSAADTNAHVIAGASGDGINIGYDAFGERVSATYAYDGHNEHYDYDAGGYLTTTTIRNSAGTITGSAVRTNDLAGRVTHYVETSGSTTVQDTGHTYDADSQLMKDVDYLETAKAGHDVGTATDRLADGTVKDTRTFGQATVTTTSYNYVWYDTAKQTEVHIQASNDAAPSWKPGLSKFVYDSEGRLVSAIDVVGKRAFSYQVDAEGRILRRDELLNVQLNTDGTVKYGEANRQHTYYYMDGNQIGNIGNDGPERIDYARELAEHMQQTANKDDSHKRFTPVAFADFDANYQPINSTYPASAPTSYIVHAGDTLPSIAQAIWGDSSLWWMLADANNLTLTDALVANTVLTVPNKVTNIHNNSTTVRPYDPGIAIGNTQPTLPDPPPPPPAPKQHGGGCGGVLQVVAIVVAVVVSFYTLGTTTALWGSVLDAAFAGAAGAAAGQAVMIAGGEQNGFNWQGIAISAISAGVTQGISEIPTGATTTVADAGSQSIGGALLQGAASTAASSAAASALGLQSFSWRDVAAGAVSSGVGYKVGQQTQGWQPAAQKVATTFAAGASSAAVYGSLSQNWEGIARNAIATTIGNTIAENLKSQRIDTGNLRDDVPRLSAADFDGMTVDGPEVQIEPLTGAIAVSGTSPSHQVTLSGSGPSPEWLAAQNGSGLDALSGGPTFHLRDVPRESTIDYGSMYASVPTLAPIVVTADVSQASSMGDQLLVDVERGMQAVRDQSRRNIDESDSVGMAAINSGIYAINSVTSAVVSGFVQTGRIFTNGEVRQQFFQGVGKLLTTDPRVTGEAAWDQWSNMPLEDQLTSGGAAIVSLGGGAASKVAELGTVGNDVRVLERVSSGARDLDRAGVGRAEGVAGDIVSEGVRDAPDVIPSYSSGEFSISDWTGYPAGVPKPEGPFRLLEGAEYKQARTAADAANGTIRRNQNLIGQPFDVHEVQPVKFGGSPTDPANKVILPRDVHRQRVSPWWQQLQRDLGG